MLYQLYELQRAALEPMRMMAEVTRLVALNPFFPGSYFGFGRAVAAGAEVFERLTRKFGKPEFGLEMTTIDGQPVAVTQRVIHTLPFCELLHFERVSERRDPKVLLVAPISGNHATLLRGTVEDMLPDHDLYVTDWVDASLVPLVFGPFGLDDYIAYIIDILRHLGPETHVVAICQPAVPVMAAAALMAADDDPCQPASITLIGGPIDVRVAPTGPSRLAESQSLDWFKRTVITKVPLCYPGALRPVFPGFLQLSGFMTMNLDRHIGAHVELFQHLVSGDGDSAEAHRRFYDEYLAVMDMPAEFYLDTVDAVFHRKALACGTLTFRGRPVDPAALRRPGLMTIEGERDDISAPGQTFAAHALCTGLPAENHDHLLQSDVGHFGTFHGRRWRQGVLPRLRAFIRRHDGGSGVGG